MNKQSVINQLSQILSQMMPSYPADYWQESTELFGAIPEFDSMSIVTLISEIEENFDLLMDDEDIDAENFATIDSLALLITNRVS